MSDIEGDIYAGYALIQILNVNEKALAEKIKNVEMQIAACKEEGCSKEQLELLEAEKEALSQELDALKSRIAESTMIVDQKQNCWDMVLSLYTAESEGFPGEPKRAGTVKLFQPEEAVKSLAAEARTQVEKIQKEKEKEENKKKIEEEMVEGGIKS